MKVVSMIRNTSFQQSTYRRFQRSFKRIHSQLVVTHSSTVYRIRRDYCVILNNIPLNVFNGCSQWSNLPFSILFQPRIKPKLKFHWFNGWITKVIIIDYFNMIDTNILEENCNKYSSYIRVINNIYFCFTN